MSTDPKHPTPWTSEPWEAFRHVIRTDKGQPFAEFGWTDDELQRADEVRINYANAARAAACVNACKGIPDPAATLAKVRAAIRHTACAGCGYSVHDEVKGCPECRDLRAAYSLLGGA